MEPWISVSSTQDATRANGRDGPARFEPVQLDGFADGPRFGVWWLPTEVQPRGSVLCVQPLEPERALARHALAAQAWRLAGKGWAVLMLDLYGTGDSPGAPGDATLAVWRNDLLRGALLARQRAHGPHTLWGVRGGALLGVDVAIALDQLIDAYVLWQPPEDAAALGLPDSLALSAAMTGNLQALRMLPPAVSRQGKLPAVLFAETFDDADPESDEAIASPVQEMAATWSAAGYPVQTRVEASPQFWRPAMLRPTQPTALFEATEEFLAGVR